MRFPGGVLLKFICGFGVIAASFWITSMALDYWRFRPTGPPRATDYIHHGHGSTQLDAD